MAQKPSLDHESSAVQKHLEIMQGIISRMAENSRSCKLWCVTLVAAVLVLVARTGEPQHALIALAPTGLLLLLDAYYLALERSFRKSYDNFVDKLHRGQSVQSDVYKVAATDKGIALMVLVVRCLWSVSILLFYPLLVLMVVIARLLVIPWQQPP